LKFIGATRVRKSDITEAFRIRSIRNQDKLEALKEDLREAQLLSPIIVEPIGNGKYRLIAGARRFDVYPYDEVEAKIYEFEDDVERRLTALKENVLREELNVIDLALNFKILHDIGLSYQEIALRIYREEHKAKFVGNLVRLVEKGSTDLLYHLATKDIGLKNALAVIMLPKERQSEALRHILERRLSYEETKKLIEDMLDEDRRDSEEYRKRTPGLSVRPSRQEALTVQCAICGRYVPLSDARLRWVCTECHR